MIKLEMPSLKDQSLRDLRESLNQVEGLAKAIKDEIKTRDTNDPVFFMDL